MSSCLLGNPVRYNGCHANPGSTILDKWLREGRVISVCPELAAGFPVPREPAEISHGNGLDVLDSIANVATQRGQEVTGQYVFGAQAALSLAQKEGIRVAVLKDGSPSCGSSYTYDGTFSGVRRLDGVGVTAALMRRHGIEVFSEEQLSEADARVSNLDLEQ